MKTLIVTAHPSSKGFTHQIAEAYKRGRVAKGHEVEILDLYKAPKQDFLRYEEKSDLAASDPLRDEMQKKIADAEHIVFVHPLWWVAPPAILKNFIDVNFAARFAFRYINGKKVGLLKGKSTSVFITCDGPWWIYWLIAKPFYTIWRFGILEYCGMKVKAFKLFDRKLFKSEKQQQAFLQKVEKIGRRV